MLGDEQLDDAARIFLWIRSQPTMDSMFVQATTFQSNAKAPIALIHLGIAQLFFPLVHPSVAPTRLREQKVRKDVGIGGRLPLEVRIPQYLVERLKSQLSGKVGVCMDEDNSNWDPIILGPFCGQDDGAGYCAFHMVAPSQCAIVLSLQSSIGEVVLEYLLVDSGSIIALAMCICVWQLVSFREGADSFEDAKRAEDRPRSIKDFTILPWNLGFIGVAWCALLFLPSLGEEQGLLAW